MIIRLAKVPFPSELFTLRRTSTKSVAQTLFSMTAFEGAGDTVHMENDSCLGLEIFKSGLLRNIANLIQLL